MGKNHLAGKFMFANLFKLYIFLPFWDTMVEVFFSVVGYNRRVFLHCGINGEGFPPLWDTMEEVFLHCGIQRRKISGWLTIFFSVVSQNAEVFLRGVLH
jgi:hypothetical protein